MEQETRPFPVIQDRSQGEVEAEAVCTLENKDIPLPEHEEFVKMDGPSKGDDLSNAS